jgi:hypothetical protein
MLAATQQLSKALRLFVDPLMHQQQRHTPRKVPYLLLLLLLLLLYAAC